MVYRRCIAAVPKGNWGDVDWTARPLDPKKSGPAANNPYTSEQTSGDAGAIWIGVDFTSSDGHIDTVLCTASGDPASPTVTYVRTLD